ncbi:MAG: valine--tRNA ligase [Saprospiraceae bacterium]
MLSSHFNPQELETRWYQHWMEKNYFHSEPDEREPFTIVIPPPNVTGVLHMGHMLNNTIQDILIRKARKEGKNACWVPGTDHASIATEAKVVGMLREKGIKKSDLPREEFLNYAWEWKEKYGGIILDQLKKLGCSCDWERTAFTMDPKLSQAVIKVFVDLHKKGKLYRGLRMTNWDPSAKTVLSNEEVIYKDENSQLFHIKYAFEDNPAEGIVIATQRPETIMADVAIAVHPDDERYKNIVGKKVLIPLIDRAIPIIADSYVDMEFGTAALKITPAHDQNDYEVGQRHNLEVIDILNADGTLNEAAQILVGEDRFVARKKIKKLLDEGGHLVELENYVTSIGTSERTGAVVEPRLTKQWFLDMKDFAATALKAVKEGDVKFFPENMWNMYYSWLQEDNIRDWCISRQLWWGQRIPCWYLKSDESETPFVAEGEKEALEQIRAHFNDNNIDLDDLHQDEDVVDTWFSSWLWPITVFNGFDDQKELEYYYPTNVLVTGWDIMFFWVARMIMAGYEFAPELLGENARGIQPFKDVFFTGMVRDNKRRKMSKSLGNSPDALTLIDKYGADGVRYGILSCTSAGADIIFDAPIDPATGEVLNESKLCEQGSKFCNKMWNALKLIKGWKVEDKEQGKVEKLAIEWFENRLQQVGNQLEIYFEEYRFSDAILSLYKLIWDDFCSWYLEWIKPEDGTISKATLEATIGLFEKQMSLLHPFMPFVTEEIWHQLKDRAKGEDVIVTPFPEKKAYDKNLVAAIEKAQTLVTKIRETRASNQLSSREPYPLYAEKVAATEKLFATDGMAELVSKAANLSNLEISEKGEGIAFLSGAEKYYLGAEVEVNVEEKKAELEKEIEYQKGFVNSIEKKLSNERFVSGAPAQVVDRERQKLADGQARIKILEEELGKL